MNGFQPLLPTNTQKHGRYRPQSDYETNLKGRNYELHKRSIERVIRAMSERLGEPISNEEMADIACFSPYHFNRLFRHMTGIPPTLFLYALRLARAKHLLVTTDLCVTEICLEVGYNSLGTFISRFHRVVGLAPSAFRGLARRIVGLRLADLRGQLMVAATPPPIEASVRGALVAPTEFDGAFFTGLFPRAIPEGLPVACSLATTEAAYALRVPEDGQWFAFSVAVPWSAEVSDLLTLDGLARGRSGSIRTDQGRPRGGRPITLAPPQALHPPILATMPLLVAKVLSLEFELSLNDARNGGDCEPILQNAQR